MKKVSFGGVTENAYGKALSSLKTESGETLRSLKYAADYEEYTNIDEVKAANDMPNDTEVVKYRNQQRKAKARAAAIQVSLDAAGVIKPTIENDDQLRLKRMFDIFVANGSSEAEAREKAANALNLQWSDEDDE